MLNILAISLSSCSRGTPLGVIVGLAKDVVNVIYIAAPIGIILMGSIDFFKAVIAQDESEMSKTIPSFIKRILAAVVIFLIFTLIKYIFSVILGSGTAWAECWIKS